MAALVSDLQRALFPMFTVLTNSRENAEAALILIGLSQDLPSLKATGWRRSRRSRALELFWAASMLAKHKGEKAAIDRYLNVRRFLHFWENRGDPVKLPADADAPCYQNLNYGICSHYLSSLAVWGLTESSGDEIKLTKDGRKGFFDKVFEVNASKRQNGLKRQEKVKDCLIRWFDTKTGLSEIELANCAFCFESGVDTFGFWTAQAERVAQTVSGVFPTIWQLVRSHLANIEAARAFAHALAIEFPDAPNTGFALRRWVEARVDSLASSADAALLKQTLADCRSFELIEGSARFLLYAMTSAAQNTKAPTIASLARAWSKWLAPLASAFSDWTAETRVDVLRFAFSTINPAQPETLLTAVLERHWAAKPINSIVRKNAQGGIVLTDEAPPNLDSIPACLAALTEGDASLPSDPHPESLPVWQDYCVRDWNWQRWAKWMRIEVEEPSAEPNFHAAAGDAL